MSDSRFLGRFWPRLRRRTQLSLLSLLILVCLFAVGIQYGLIPMLKQRARKAMEQRITDVGGQWFEVQAEDPYKRLLLSGSKVDDELLTELGRRLNLFPELKQLDIFKTEGTDQGWDVIIDSPSELTHVVVFENKISDNAIDAAQKRRPELKIERRAPDPIATGLAMTPIPPSAIISLISHKSRLLFGSGDGRLHSMDITGTEPRQGIQAHQDWLFDMALSPSSAFLATAGGDNRLAIWSYPILELLAETSAHEGDIHGVVWLDEFCLATVSDDKSLRSWRFTGGADADNSSKPQLELLQTLREHHKAIPRIRISRNRDRIITASRDDRMIVWGVDDLNIRKQAELIGHTDDCMDLQIDPTGTAAISVGYDGSVIVWDLEAATAKKKYDIDTNRLFCVEVDWAGRKVVAGGVEGLFELDLLTGDVTASRDQPYVARILGSKRTIYSSDGFGGIYVRNRSDLFPFAHATTYENPYDDYSDNRFRPWPSAPSSGVAVRTVGNS